MGGIRLSLGMALLFACGDDSGTARVDAPDGTGDDGGGSGSDGSMQGTCDFTEAADATNRVRLMAETTSLTFGATPLAICGTINNGHFDAPTDEVDADFFEFAIAAETDVLIHVAGAGIATPDLVVMQLANANLLAGFGVVEGDHGAIAAHLTAGNYTIAVGALNPQDLSAVIDYRVTIVTDAPATRCPAKTGTPDHPESADGGANNMNDVITFDSDLTPESGLTSSGGDAPETTGISVASATSYLITGTAENVNPGDDYMDRDTFEFTTGATTNQMSIRLNWPGTTTDLDYRVYPPTTGDPLSIVGGLKTAQMESEFETFAVKPSTTYWLWVAEEDGSTAPATYSATLCGETFTP